MHTGMEILNPLKIRAGKKDFQIILTFAKLNYAVLN